MALVAAFAASAASLPVATITNGAADEIGREHRQPIELVLRVPILDRHVLARGIASFLQALEKRNGDVLEVNFSGLEAEEPDHRLLRATTGHVAAPAFAMQIEGVPRPPSVRRCDQRCTAVVGI
jgi:hypothetical protein